MFKIQLIQCTPLHIHIPRKITHKIPLLVFSIKMVELFHELQGSGKFIHVNVYFFNLVIVKKKII